MGSFAAINTNINGMTFMCSASWRQLENTNQGAGAVV